MAHGLYEFGRQNSRGEWGKVRIVMTKTDWHDRWNEGRIGFHRPEVHPLLLSTESRFTHDGKRVFVPLAGKSLDLLHLAKEGLDVVAVELVGMAVEALFAEAEIAHEVSQHGPFKVYRAKGITVYVGDFFDLEPEVTGTFDRIWDRASLVALPKDVRKRYTAHLRRFAAPGARLLLSCLEYDQSVMEGPPFSVSRSEVGGHYGDLDLSEISRADVIESSRWKERGHTTWIEAAYLIQF